MLAIGLPLVKANYSTESNSVLDILAAVVSYEGFFTYFRK